MAVALGLALGIQAFLIKPYKIPSASMVPTLVEGQRVLATASAPRFSDPDVGDVVVFHPPEGAEQGDKCGAPPPTGQVCLEETPEKADGNFISAPGWPGPATACRSATAT